MRPLLIASALINIALLFYVTTGQALRASRYPYLSPRVAILEQENAIISFIPLRSAMIDYVLRSPEKIGVFFEYLPSGVSIGINDEDVFISASLMKVPIAMATMKLIEEGKLTMGSTLTIADEDIDPAFGTEWNRGGGHMTVREALDLSIRASDNTAARVLIREIFRHGDTRLSNVFESLDVLLERDEDRVLASPAGYSSILRSLFLASYLSKSHSNDLLKTMTGLLSVEMLPAGVAPGVPVAHKIGIFEEDDHRVYADCGIVYVPSRQFLLCTMVAGEEEQAQKHISTLARMAYEFVSSTHTSE